MEDVLDVYERPYDPLRPVVCMDEKPYQLLGEGKEPLPMKPGSDKKLDSEYVRNGTCSIFAMIEPLGGWHRVSVREHRTAVDWAEEIKEMIHYTPKHGSWLDIAEIELNMMTRQCLDRRIDNIETLKRELGAWECKKNNEEKKVIWQFRTKDARIKLASLYPKLG